VKLEQTAGNPTGLFIIGKHDGGVSYGTGITGVDFVPGDTYHLAVTINDTSISARVTGTGVDETCYYSKTAADQSKFNGAAPFGYRIRYDAADEDNLASRFNNLMLTTADTGGGGGGGGGGDPGGGTNTWSPSGIDGGGFVNVIGVSADGNTLYCGSDVGGMARSEDKGLTWTPANRGVTGRVNKEIAGFGPHPTDPNVVVVAAGQDILLSTDRGRNWTYKIQSSFEGHNLVGNSIGVPEKHPRNTGRVFAWTTISSTEYLMWGSYDAGFFISSNRATSATLVGLSNTAIRGIKMHGNLANVVFVGCYQIKALTGGLYKITNPQATGTSRTIEKLSTPFNSVEEVDTWGDHVIVVGSNIIRDSGGNITSQTDGVWLSDNSGANWTRLGVGSLASNGNWCSVKITEEAGNGNLTIYAGCSNPEVSAGYYKSIMRSTDSGVTWSWITSNPNVIAKLGNASGADWWQTDNNWWLSGIQAVSAQIECDPADPALVYSAGRSGVWRSENANVSSSSVRWYASMKGLCVASILDVVFDDTLPGRAYAANVDWDSFYSTDYFSSAVQDDIPMEGSSSSTVGQYKLGGGSAPRKAYVGGGSRDLPDNTGGHVKSSTNPATTSFSDESGGNPAVWGSERPYGLGVRVISGTTHLVAAVQGDGIWTKHGASAFTKEIGGLLAGNPEVQHTSVSWERDAVCWIVDRNSGLWRGKTTTNVMDTWELVWGFTAASRSTGFCVASPTDQGTVFVSKIDGLFRLTNAFSGTVSGGQVTVTSLGLANAGPLCFDENGWLYVTTRAGAGDVKFMRYQSPGVASPVGVNLADDVYRQSCILPVCVDVWNGHAGVGCDGMGLIINSGLAENTSDITSSDTITATDAGSTTTGAEVGISDSDTWVFHDEYYEQPAAHWNMEEASGNLIDTVANYQMVPDGTVGYRAWSKDGSYATDYAAVGGFVAADADDFAFLEGTAECWVRSPYPGGGYIALVSKNQNYWLGLYDSQLSTYDWTTSTTHISNAYVNDGAWHHVAVTWVDGGNVILYFDGWQRLTASYDVLDPAALPLEIGQNTSGQRFTGQIDEVNIYSHVLTPAQIRAHALSEGPVAYYKMEELSDPVVGATITWNVAGGMTANSNTEIERTGGTPSDWSGAAWSSENHPDAGLQFKVKTIGSAEFMVGLNADPSSSNSWENLDFAFYFTGSVMGAIYESGAVIIALSAAYTVSSTVFAILCDGQKVRYYIDGVLVWTSRKIPPATLYLDSSFATIGSAVEGIEFGTANKYGIVLHDTSPWALDLNRNGAATFPTQQATGLSGYGVTFNGGVSRFMAGAGISGAASREGTVMIWIKPTAQVSGFMGVMAKVFNYGLYLLNGEPIAYDWQAGTGRVSGVNVVDSQWHHLAFAWLDGIEGRLYVDGVERWRGVYNLHATSNLDADRLRIGDTGDGVGAPDTVTFDEAAVFNRMLAPWEIQLIAEEAVTPDEILTDEVFGNLTLVADTPEAEQLSIGEGNLPFEGGQVEIPVPPIGQVPPGTPFYAIRHLFNAVAGEATAAVLDTAAEDGTGGYTTVTGKVLQDAVPSSILTPGAEWRIYGSDGTEVWYGNLIQSVAREGYLELTGRGTRSRAERFSGRLMFLSRNAADFQPADSDPYNYKTGDAYEISAEGSRISITAAKGTTMGPTVKEGIVFWAEGNTLNSVAFDMSWSGSGAVLKNYLRIMTALGPNGPLTQEGGDIPMNKDPADVDRPLTGRNVGVKRPDLVWIGMHRVDDTTEDITSKIKMVLTNVRIRGLATTDEFFGQDVVKEVCARLGFATDWVQFDGVNLHALDHKDGSFADLLDLVSVLTGYRWRILHNAQGLYIDFGPWDDHTFYTVRAAGPSDVWGTTIYNRVSVRYTTTRGITREIMADPLDINLPDPYEQGLEIVFPQDGSVQLVDRYNTRDAAEQVATRLLRQVIKPRLGGSIDRAWLEDENGNIVPAYHAMSGDTIILKDGASGQALAGRVIRRVVGNEYCTFEFDNDVVEASKIIAKVTRDPREG